MDANSSQMCALRGGCAATPGRATSDLSGAYFLLPHQFLRSLTCANMERNLHQGEQGQEHDEHEEGACGWEWAGVKEEINPG